MPRVKAHRSGAGRRAVAGGVLASAAAAAAGQCPPGTFNYGPYIDPMISAIVIDHFGAGGPLLPDPAHVARAALDVALIRQAFPEMAAVGHSTRWAAGALTVQASLPLSVEFVCANEYYRAALLPIGGSSWWALDFPVGTFNPEAMAAIYREIPGVQDAGIVYWVCAGFCCGSTWSYEPDAAGTWRWTVRMNRSLIRGCNLPPIERSFLVTQDGEVSRVCYANCDGSTQAPVLNVDDFLCFQAVFAAGDPQANCDGSTAEPVLNVNDFVCFQEAYVRGCP